MYYKSLAYATHTYYLKCNSYVTKLAFLGEEMRGGTCLCMLLVDLNHLVKADNGFPHVEALNL